MTHLPPVDRLWWIRALAADSDLSRTVLRVALAVVSAADHDGVSAAGTEGLVEITGISDREVRRAISDLESRGWVERLTTGGGRGARAAVRLSARIVNPGSTPRVSGKTASINPGSPAPGLQGIGAEKRGGTPRVLYTVVAQPDQQSLPILDLVTTKVGKNSDTTPTPDLDLRSPVGERPPQKSLVSKTPRVSRRGSSESKGSAVWSSYAAAYRDRYREDPVRNARANALCCQLVDRIGAEDAPKVAAYYLTISRPFYVQRFHPLTALIADAEGIRTAWATNTRPTDTQARQLDRTAAMADTFETVRRLRAEERAAAANGRDPDHQHHGGARHGRGS